VGKSIAIPILCSLSMVFLISGFILSWKSRKYRTDQASRFFAWDPRQWRPIWRGRELFTRKGYRLCLVGHLMISAGSALLVVVGILS